MSDSATDSLKALHTAAIDSRNGYDEALKESDNPQDLAAVFARMSALHGENAAQLAEQLHLLGEKPDEDGSFMSTVHQVVMDVRSWFNGLGTSVLPGLIDGETRNIETYDDAIADVVQTPDILEVLVAQRARLFEALDALKAMEAAT